MHCIDLNDHAGDSIKMHFDTEPVRSTEGDLLGIELRCMYFLNNQPVVRSEYFSRTLTLKQKERQFLYCIEFMMEKYDELAANNLFCVIPVDTDMAGLIFKKNTLQVFCESLPFMKLSFNFDCKSKSGNDFVLRKLYEMGYSLWATEHYAFNSSMNIINYDYFESVVINGDLHSSHIGKPIFCSLISCMQRFFSSVYIDGCHDVKTFHLLKHTGVSGIKGAYINNMNCDLTDRIKY